MIDGAALPQPLQYRLTVIADIDSFLFFALLDSKILSLARGGMLPSLQV